VRGAVTVTSLTKVKLLMIVRMSTSSAPRFKKDSIASNVFSCAASATWTPEMSGTSTWGACHAACRADFNTQQGRFPLPDNGR
jgi:hypothetical protein